MAKTHTSTAVKQRWLNENTKPVQARLPKDLVERWETKLTTAGIGKAEFLRTAILAYLSDEKEP